MTPTLWLIGTDVPLDVYGGDRLQQALSDINWVGTIAVAHEQVVEHFAARRGITVVPMKLFTMFSNRARAIADVKRRRVAIERVMRKVAGCEEWGVRIFRGTGETPPTNAASRSRPGSGAAFLAAKKQARDAAREARVAAVEAATRVFAELAGISRDARRRDDAPPAGTPAPLLDAAFLVPASRRAAFTRQARREAEVCARAGARMLLSGPWPAYNFVHVNEPAR